MHIYVDESKSKGYLLAAVIVAPGKVVALRKLMKGFLMPGQRYLHFVNESNPRRKRILSQLEVFGIEVRIYRIVGLNPILARGLCLRALMDDLESLNAAKLVFEKEESALRNDENLLRQGLLKRGLKRKIEYSHVLKHEEPAVWAADAIAWSFARGEDYRRRAMTVIDRVINITP